MLDIAIMIEGQNGLTWERWKRIAKAVEALGFSGLYRSDHYTNANPPDKDSLELWVSLTWLASHTERIEFGPLVSPVSFRHPTMTARMAASVDDLSGGRFTLGLGAGWQEREHTNFGWDLLDPPKRFIRFEEGLEVITQLLNSVKPVDFNGEYYKLNEAILLPRPERPNGPPILIGGNGSKRTLPLVAKYADEWNALFITPDKFAELNKKLNRHLEAENRQPESVRRSLMTGCVFGSTDAQVEGKVKSRGSGKFSIAELKERGLVVGTPDDILEQLASFAKAGVERIMLQWLDLDDIDGLEAMALSILPQTK
ncbi:MAG: LLM class F420-dependent oxidoreductase [Anaerolineales bacterium]|nr:LLM class F420-dependent oxidoreductase [Anaerolineales bacterium]